MGLRYRIPFVSIEDRYEVEIYRGDYESEPTELTGAVGCFVVTGTDEPFVYTPVRPSTATIRVIDSDVLSDLYSINNQYAPVRFFKNGILEWTGYIKPEQFTQPYVNAKQSISVECVSAVSTLEHITYKELTTSGIVSMWSLLKYIISRCNGGYRGVYIPWVYGASHTMTDNVLERITLIENNFLKEEMTLYEVLESICKFLGWVCYDIGGCLWFVDVDHRGSYRMYDEALTTFVEVQREDVMIQDVGLLDSDGNTIDVVPGYNKASVKALNHVFENVVKDEPYDILKPYDNGNYLSFAYAGADGGHGVRKQFLKPMFWKMYNYDSYGILMDEKELEGYSGMVLNYTRGAVLVKEADYRSVSATDYTPHEDVTDFNYVDSVQIRVQQESTSIPPSAMLYNPVLTMTGENAVYADCAISIDGTFEAYFDKDMAGPSKRTDAASRNLLAVVSCGGRWYNGSSWVNEYATVTIEIDESGKIKSNRTPFTPYKDISGYVIPMDFFVGEPEITILCPLWTEQGDYATGIKIRNLKFGYAKKDGVVEEGEDGDRIYENIVNEAYMSECDVIEFGISSYNADGASFSKALLDGRWLTNNLYCTIVDENIRPEELMIRRIVNRYGKTKLQLTEGMRMPKSVTPITNLYDRSMVDKRFLLISGEWDYERNKLTIQMQEDVHEES